MSTETIFILVIFSFILLIVMLILQDIRWRQVDKYYNEKDKEKEKENHEK